MKFLPKMYKKNIYEINYKILKKRGIKVLFFDLDNTLGKIDEDVPDNKIKDFIMNLKKDFKVLVISNSKKERVSKFANSLDVDYVHFSLKPSKVGLLKGIKKAQEKISSIAMIGDQLVTDIYGANRLNIFSILVDPLSKKDLKITSLNRIIEAKIIEKYKKTDIFKRGRYYE